MNAKQIKALKELVNNFTLDGESDYARMRDGANKIVGKSVSNDTVWGLINRVPKTDIDLSVLDE